MSLRALPKESGFTMIELLVSIGIIGLLAAIAVPQFKQYKAGGYDAEAQQTLRAIATAEEAYFVDYTKYKDCDQSTCATVLPNVEPVPIGIVLQINSTPTGFVGLASHIQGSGTVFTYP